MLLLLSELRLLTWQLGHTSGFLSGPCSLWWARLSPSCWLSCSSSPVFHLKQEHAGNGSEMLSFFSHNHVEQLLCRPVTRSSTAGTHPLVPTPPRPPRTPRAARSSSGFHTPPFSQEDGFKGRTLKAAILLGLCCPVVSREQEDLTSVWRLRTLKVWKSRSGSSGWSSIRLRFFLFFSDSKVLQGFPKERISSFHSGNRVTCFPDSWRKVLHDSLTASSGGASYQCVH